MSSRKDKKGGHKRGSRDKDSKKSTSEKTRKKLEDELSQYLEELDQLRNERSTYAKHAEGSDAASGKLLVRGAKSTGSTRIFRQEGQTEDLHDPETVAQRHKKETDRMQTHSKFLAHTSEYQAEEYVEYGEDLKKVDRKIASVESKVEEIRKILGDITTDEPGGLDDYLAGYDDDDDAAGGGPSGPMDAGAWDRPSYGGYGYGGTDAHSQYA
ncbi:hypothetical protein QBC33DRAFT_514904 [Phialemonium atrogriseum]|uniref:Uncharacterized protein n=1 Tax=Phialemonium atrogriseum TaxID=1093897 RepID=A0AAJ0FG79_9PEZI|nr:uncharacterized protein QBC33DRAFT_514904 [Phialemonium atrogriseum]KAK1767336.1 hypothetical protein QBC33DRAFT_514904 [Phialemonium atrogriseum]